MKRLYYILFLLLIACKPNTLSNTGDLIIDIGSKAAITKAPFAADGDKMNSIKAFLVDKDNKVVAYAANDYESSVTIDPSGTSAQVIAKAVNTGIYTLYIIANAPDSFTYDEHTTTITSSFIESSISLGLSEIEPTFSESSGMPLSIVKTVTITSGFNRIKAELLRVCARLKVYFSNNTTALDNLNLVVNSISFDSKNPNKTYLFSKDNSVISYTTKAFKTYTNTTNVISIGQTNCLYETYLFETGPDLSSLNITVKGGIIDKSLTPAYDATNNMTNATKTFNQTFPVTYIDDYSVAHTLNNIKRNEEVDLTINVYYSPEIHEFTFKILDWTKHNYETTFD